MKIRITFLSILTIISLRLSAQAPVITSPTNGQTGALLKFNITATSNSTGNSTTSKDIIYLELSKDISFNSSQTFPDYQKTSGTWNKSNDLVLNMTWAFTGTLSSNTTYYVRGVSSKWGIGPVVSFTTQGTATSQNVTYPTEGQTGLPLKFTITGTSNSTGNSSSSKDLIYFELSKNISFSSAQGTPNYQKSSVFQKIDDATLNMSWIFTGTLDTSTTYYIRMVSSKGGLSGVISFTTGNTFIQSITYPSNGQTGLPQKFTIKGVSNSTGNSSSSYDVIYFELSKSKTFSSSQGSPDYQKSATWNKSTNSALTMNWAFPATIAGNSTYYTRLVSSKNGYSAIDSFTTIGMTAPVLTSIDGISVATNPYANNATYVLTSTSITGTTQYNWQFDIEGDFVTPEYATSSATNSLNLAATALLSGQAYWVRVQAVSSTIPSSSSWSASTPVQYYNSLHAATYWSPTGTSTNRSFKLWANNNVANATTYYFQVDDNKDFSSPYNNQNYLDTTVSWVSGSVFKAKKEWYQNTGFTASNNPILYKVFDYLYKVQDQTKYYVRVMASNSNQNGYWGPIDSVFVSVPARSNPIKNITDNQTNVAVDYVFIITDDPNYDETSFDFQIAYDNSFSSLAVNQQNVVGFSKQVNGLKYNTDYYVRARSYINNSYPSNPGNWSTPVKFTTTDLNMAISSPTAGQVWSSLTTKVFAYTKTGVTSYEFEIQKTSGTPSSTTKTNTTNSVAFNTFVTAGQTYQVRVRGIVASQSYTSNWSSWVSFSTSASAHRIGNIEDYPNLNAETFAFPNPFDKECLVPISEDLTNVNVTVTNELGAKIEEINLSQGASLTLGKNWTQGLYFVYIKSEDEFRVIKLEKK